MSDHNESMLMRLLAALVRKNGGKATITVEEYNAGSDFSIEFDPPATDDGPPTTHIHLTAGPARFDNFEDELEDEDEE